MLDVVLLLELLDDFHYYWFHAVHNIALHARCTVCTMAECIVQHYNFTFFAGLSRHLTIGPVIFITQ